MATFKIPEIPSTSNKTIRIPNNLIEEIEHVIRGKNCTFTDFIIAAIKTALQDLREANENCQ